MLRLVGSETLLGKVSLAQGAGHVFRSGSPSQALMPPCWRFPKKIEWVFTKPTGTPYTARSRHRLKRTVGSGSSERGTH